MVGCEVGGVDVHGRCWGVCAEPESRVGVVRVEAGANAEALLGGLSRCAADYWMSAKKIAYLGVIMYLVRRPLAEAMHLLIIRDFRHRHISSIAVCLHANTRSCPLQYGLQTPIEPGIPGPVFRVADCPQVIVCYSDRAQIIPRQLAQHLATRYPDDREIARGVERKLHGAFLRSAEDGGPVGLCELRRGREGGCGPFV